MQNFKDQDTHASLTDKARPSKRRPVNGTVMFATTIPGLAPILIEELQTLEITGGAKTGFDGRSEVVVFEASRGTRTFALQSKIAEDIFVQLGTVQRQETHKPLEMAKRIWQSDDVQRALSIYAEATKPLRANMTFRVIVRVLDERDFQRTDLRDQLIALIQKDKPRWEFADPASMEVWVIEYQPGTFIAGLRLSNASMRQHDGREVERSGALRPTVAAAMIQLTDKAYGTLLDPCCGSGTILSEGIKSGWKVIGSDIDPEAVAISQQNAPSAVITMADARSIHCPNESIDACISNLPFGKQFSVQGDSTTWLKDILKEMSRVTREQGSIILLIPDIPQTAIPQEIRFSKKYPIRLLGTDTTIWKFEKLANKKSTNAIGFQV